MANALHFSDLRRHAHVAVLLAVTTGSAFAQTTATDPVAAFVASTNEYAAIHRRIERQLPPLAVNSNPETIRRAVETMANAIRVVRADAQQGDFFTPALAFELRRRINTALLEHGFTSEDLRSAEWGDGIDPSTARLAVNGTFPWAFGSAMFPCVINALPPLPAELQYRIVGHTLVLIDLHASLIVDLLPNAVIEPTVTDLDRGIFRGSAKIPRRH